MSSLLFQISPVDPLTHATVLLTIIAATCLASYVPAQRATAVDPIEAPQIGVGFVRNPRCRPVSLGPARTCTRATMCM